MKKLIIFLLLLGFNGFSQDDRLFENIWYLHDLVIDGESNIPPVNNEIPFVPADFNENGDLYTGICDEEGIVNLEYIGTTAFEVLDAAFFTGGCHQNYPFNQKYSGLYQGFWGSLWGIGAIPYEIVENGTYRILTVTNPNGDYALFANEIPLSINDFSGAEFLIYPTLVQNSFTIYSRSNIEIQKITIYNLFGQNAFTPSLQQSEIDISHLKSGIYFVSVQDTSNQMTTIKIVKR
ncbi:MAG: T9SS type A sorting domain-containing protein [Flavobacteriaceae bacterium]